MDAKKSKRFLFILAAAFWVLATLIFLSAGSQFRYSDVVGDALSPTGNTGEIIDGMVVTQRLAISGDELTGIEMIVATFWRANTGTLHISVENADGQLLIDQAFDISLFKESEYTRILFEQSAKITPNESLTLRITTSGCSIGNAIALSYGNMVTAGRFDKYKEVVSEDAFTVNDIPGAGMLCARLTAVKHLSFYRTYWLIVLTVFIAMVAYVCISWNKAVRGCNNGIAMICTLYCKYGFLLRQLVQRDFKIKYKRSVLGMAWSIINPLLTMAVQYVVFSTLFQSNVPNYSIYLLSGIVLFNFFADAVSAGMSSISGNASLIKKVYMPKYIYPISKLVSSLINFGLALIPLFLVMLLTGTVFRISLLLLIFDFLCMIAFILGMILLLSTAMTFFQDTQFLWGIVSMIWLYLTPLFYPESIIPQRFLTLFHMNPLYQYITFARICIINGVSPEPMAYLWCIVPSIIVLGLGIWVFKKHQDQFVLHL